MVNGAHIKWVDAKMKRLNETPSKCVIVLEKRMARSAKRLCQQALLVWSEVEGSHPV